MAAVGGGGDEVATVSPESRVKFLCSHGGKILPRPNDGHLKYFGGETRVVVVPRDIGFSGLMKKLAAIAEADVVLKYQLMPKDLDTLVSVTCDEDLIHMLDEYDRHDIRSSEGGSTPKLRSFLFPSQSALIGNKMYINDMDNNALEQRYIDAINGVIHNPNYNTRRSNISIIRPTPTISSTGSGSESSPTSIISESHMIEGLVPNNYHNSRINEMHRISSSPNFRVLAQQNHPSHQLQQHEHSNYSPSRLHCPYSNQCGHGRLVTALSLGRSDFGRSQMGGHVPNWHFSPPARQPTGFWGASYGPIDERCSIYRSGEFEKGETHHRTYMKQTWE